MKSNHKNVVKCFGHFPMSGENRGNNVQIVMELCHGTLKDLTSAKKLKDYELSRLMKQMLEGIDHMHENGVIHRQVKNYKQTIDQMLS